MVMNDSLTTSLFDIDVMSVKENQAKGDWSGAPLKRAEENLRRKFNADQKLIQEILLIPAVGK